MIIAENCDIWKKRIVAVAVIVVHRFRCFFYCSLTKRCYTEFDKTKMRYVMKKRIFNLVSFVFGIAVICGFISCNNGISSPKQDEENVENVQNIEKDPVLLGSISGKAIYSNLTDNNHSGIVITIDKTDGLRTAAVLNTNKIAKCNDNARAIINNSLTTKDGSYLFENLEPGLYTVYAASLDSSEKAVCTNVVVRASEISVAEDLKLTATGSLSGKITVRDSVDNSGFIVYAAGTSYLAITDVDGNFTISGIPANIDFPIIIMKGTHTFLWKTKEHAEAFGNNFIESLCFTSDFGESPVLDVKDGKDGKNGENGKDGKDGTSIVWKGSYESSAEIDDPQYLWAFFNTSDGCSYIYNGTEWTLLAAAGQNASSGENGSGSENGSSGENGSEDNPPVNCTINYELNGGSLPDSAPLIHTYGRITALMAPNERDNYSFEGYYFTSDFSGNPITQLGDDYTSEQTIYAKWVATLCIRYLNNAYEVVAENHYNPLDLGNACILSASNAGLSNLTGYNFERWETRTELNGQTLEGPSLSLDPNTLLKDISFEGYSSIYLFPVYTPIEYSITYICNGAVNNSDNPDKYTVEDTIVIKKCVLNDRSYRWVLSGTDTVCTGWQPHTYSGDIELEIHYVNEITYELNGGTNSTQNPISYLASNDITLYEPTSGGRVFEGWYLDRTFEGEPITGWTSGTRNEDITLYAKWSNPTAVSILAMTESGTIEISGDISRSFLLEVSSAIKQIHNSNLEIEINLDLSKVTSLTQPGDALFADCSGLKSIILPACLSRIPDNTFANCALLEKVEIADNCRLSSVGRSAFENCSSLESVELSDSLQSIKQRAFYGCINLKHINLSERLSMIHEEAFVNCQNLEELIIPASIRTLTIKQNAFVNCIFRVFYIQDDSQLSLNNSFIDCGAFIVCGKDAGIVYTMNYFNSYPIIVDGCYFDYEHDEVTGTVNQCLLRCYIGNATEIVLPSEITDLYGNTITSYEIGKGVFSDRTKLSSITIPDNVTGIHEQAFSGCTNLSSVVIPDGSTWYVFDDDGNDIIITPATYSAEQIASLLTGDYSQYAWLKE